MGSSRWSTYGRLAAVTAAAAATLAGTAVPGHALSNVATERLAGANRYATAAAVANAAYPDGAETVLVASGTSFADALSGSALAGRQSAPVLLTDPTKLSTETSAAIDDLEAENAVILGGTAAVSQEVETELASKVTVTRIAGADRYDTAARIAAAIGAANIGSTQSRRTALIATGLNFADALAGGGLAAAGSGGQLPVLLVDDNGVPDTTEKALRDLQITQTIILGGTSAVSSATASELQTITGNAPTRIAGADRFGTAAAIASAELASFGFSSARVLLANGIVPADALAGGPLAGKLKVPVLLTTASPLSEATRAWLGDHTDTVATITALGGTAAVADETLDAAKSAAQGEDPGRANEEIVVTPQSSELQPNSGTRTYTASGLTGLVDIALVLCEKVTTSSSGNTRFANSNGNSVADGTSRSGNAPDATDTPASISSVNGSPNVGTDNDSADDASPSDGKVTFVVSGPSSGTTCVVPVVYTDANSDDALNSSTSNPASPSEAFGTGGSTEFGPATGAAGTFQDRTVQSSTDESDRFVACTATNSCSTYFYDSGDDFQVAGDDVTEAQFEETLTPGDVVSGTYAPGGKSTFNITNDAGPAAPSIVNAENADGDQVDVTFNDSSTATVDSYNVYRADRTGSTCGAYALAGSVDNDPDGTALERYTFSDDDVTSGQSYCYVVRSVDDGDEGPNSTPATVTVD